MAGIPQVITEDRASGAQFIDGSLKFDSSKSTHLQRTQVGGNRKIFTWSAWVKKGQYNAGASDSHDWFSASEGNTTAGVDYGFGVRFPYFTGHSTHSDQLMVFEYENSGFKMRLISEQTFRDHGGFYHIVIAVDTTIASPASDRVKVYINGERITAWKSGYEAYPSQNLDLTVNESGKTSQIGCSVSEGSDVVQEADGYASNFYLIDGQQLGPEEFGFTDPLTNTWRPKKYDGTFGTNGFWLPMDGNTPIGKDQSGNGNDFTPKRFGGSNTIEKATGALPILNTVNGGTTATVGVRTDAYASSLVLALPLVGSTNDVSNQINSGSTTKTFTTFGNAAASNAQSNFYGRSYDFDGSGDYLEHTLSDSTFLLQGSVWTVECWVRPNASSDRVIFNVGNGTSANSDYVWQLRYISSKFQGALYNGNTQRLTSATNTSPLNVWHHVVYQRNGNTQTLYVNGILESTTSWTETPNNNSSCVLTVGGGYNGSDAIDAQIQDVRVYNGVEKYTSNFIPASTNPDILPDTPSGITGKTNLTKITEGAVYFDGTGDYCSSGSSDFTLGTGDFTVECFMTKDDNSHRGIWQISSTAGGLEATNYTQTLALGYQSDRWQLYAGGSQVDGPSPPTNGSVAPRKWYHLAVVRNSGITKLYVDGRMEISTSDTYNYTGTYMAIGGYYDTSYLHIGNISNLRVIKGTALYTSNFTPPTEPLTEVTNTKLLCCQSNTSADAAAVLPDGQITVTNNSGTAGAYAPTGLTGGIVFPSGQGTTDHSNGMYLSSPSTSFAGNYTIEFWFNVDTLPSEGSGAYGSVFFDGRPTSSGNADNVFGSIYGYNTTGSSSDFTMRYHADAADKITGTTNLSVNTWYHYALVRNNGTVTQYINGTADGSYSHSTAMISNVDRPYIGAWGFGSGGVPGHNNYAVDGKMSNLRMTSTAVYTANFSPPTSNLTTIPGTTFLGLQSTSSATAYTFVSGYLNVNGNAAATNFNPFTDDINTIRGQESGYATLNPIDKTPSVIATRGTTLSDGNLTSTVVSGADNRECVANISATSGKYYYEVMFNPGANSTNSDGAGWVADDGLGVDNSTTGGFMMIARDVGSTIVGNNGSRTNEAAGTHLFDYYPGDVMGCAIDLDSRIATWYKNGQKHSFVVDFSSRTNLDGLKFKPLLLNRLPGSVFANFGQKPFKFPPPDGFQPLNLSTVKPEKVITRPDQYVGVSLWSGNGTSQNITGLKHKPDFVWIKKREGGTARSHQLFDSVRGVYKTLHSDSTNGEDTNTNRLTAFNQDGFTVGGDDGANGSSGTFVGWTWKAGGNKNTFNIDDVGYASASDVNMNAGALNSSVYNQGSTNYTTSQVTGDDYSWASSATNGMFDGQKTTIRAARSQLTFTWTTSITLTTLRLMVHKEGGTTSINITDSNGQRNIASLFPTTSNSDVTNGNLTFVNVPVSGTLTEIEVNADPSGVGYQSGIAMVEVDGKILVDNGVTLPNIPSMAATGSSVGTKQGFSIVSYTGTGGSSESIPHGLGQSPDFVIIKNRDGGTSGSAGGWYSIYHDGFTNNHMYGFNNVSSSDAAWNNHGQITGTTSNVVQVANGDHPSANNWWTHSNGADYIMYSWHNVPGLQKFGTYTGNGNADGPFIELGFKPAIFWMKAANATANWVIIDSKRPGYNPEQKTLCPNLSNAENASGGTTNDILSNGFKVRGTTDRNSSGVTYIYCAWAEAPTLNLYGAQSNAR